MTVENMSHFVSGMSAGAMCVGDVVMILFVAAGYWRWGVFAIAAVMAGVNVIGTTILMSYGDFGVSPALVMTKVTVASGVAVLPIAALIAWGCGLFFKVAGGLNVR